MRKRKRQYEDDEELYEEGSGDEYGGRHSLHDYGFGNGAKRSTRTSARASSERSIAYESGAESRALRPRSEKKYRDYGKDELQNSDDEDNFLVVRSDIVKTRGRPKRNATAKAKKGDNSDIEFESTRRSSRPNKAKKSMKEIFDDDDDDDIFYVQETKPTAPRIASVREVFKPAPVDFKEAHRLVCDSCGYPEAILIREPWSTVKVVPTLTTRYVSVLATPVSSESPKSTRTPLSCNVDFASASTPRRTSVLPDTTLVSAVIKLTRPVLPFLRRKHPNKKENCVRKTTVWILSHQ